MCDGNKMKIKKWFGTISFVDYLQLNGVYSIGIKPRKQQQVFLKGCVGYVYKTKPPVKRKLLILKELIVLLNQVLGNISTLWFRRGFLAGKCNAGRVFFTYSKLSILRCEYKLLLSLFVLASQNMCILAEFKLGEIWDRQTRQCLLHLDLSEPKCCCCFLLKKHITDNIVFKQ